MPPATRISIDRAKEQKLFYFVATVVAYREADGRCLLLKRHERETAHPGKFGVIGGKLEWTDLDLAHPTRQNGDVLDFDDMVERLCQREAREEAGIELCGDLRYLRSIVFVRPDQVPVVCVKMAGRYRSGKVTVEAGSFTDYAWVNGDEVSRYDCIATVDTEVRAAIAAFSK